MRKIILAILLGMLLLIEIVAGALIFLDIQVLQLPGMTITVDLIAIDSEAAILHHDVAIRNPNRFDLVVRNIQVVATTGNGDAIARVTIDGGTIPSLGNRIFSSYDRIAFTDTALDRITSKVTGTFGINFLGILQKTLPLDITVITKVNEAVQHITLPTVSIGVEFGAITREDIDLTTHMNVTNANTFEISLNDMTITVDTDTGERVGDLQITGGTIPSESSTAFTGRGTILVEALNAKKLLITLTAEVGATIAGITKSLPFSSTLELTVPNLNEFIPSDKPLEIALKVDFQRARGGLQGNMTLEIVNPTKIPLLARDIMVDYYRVKNNQKFFIAEGPLGSGELTPENQTVFSGEIFLPYTKIFAISGGGLLPDMIFAQLRANISYTSVNQALPIALGSYIDLQPFRPSR